MIFLVVSLLVGVVLGQRFRVSVLIPAIAVTLLLAIGFGVTRADTFWSTVLLVITAATSIQIGYLIGMGLDHVLTGSLVASTTSRSARRPAH
jgi:hypothetical protein